MNCSTCKNWKPRDEYETGHSLGLGKCAAAAMFWDATEWDEEGNARQFKPAFKDTKAFVQDGSDYKADLLTRPDFGCVSYADRPTPQGAA